MKRNQITQVTEGAKKIKVISKEEEVFFECCDVLPGDLMVEILKRLPVKSILRFKSVSKVWNNMFLSPSFTAKHFIYQKAAAATVYLHNTRQFFPCDNPNGINFCPSIHLNNCCRSKNLVSLISQRDYDSSNTVTNTTILPPILTENDAGSTFIVGCSNGLVCFRYYHKRMDRYNYGLWNPATHIFKLLPVPNYSDEPNFAFSYVPPTDTYKLVQVCFHCICSDGYYFGTNAKFRVRVEILEVGKNSWRSQIVNFIKVPDHIQDQKPIIANGCLYWLGFLKDEGYFLISFDLEKEVFRQTDLPILPGSVFKRNKYKLTAYEESLAVFANVDGDNEHKCLGKFFEVWIYEGSSESWRKKFTLGPVPPSDFPVGFLGNQEIIISNLEFNVKVSYLYNAYNNEKRIFPCRDMICDFGFFPYTECLFQV